MANKIRLVVGGIEYMVLSEEDETFVRKIGDDLNKKLDDIKLANRYLSTTMVAVMAALDYSEQLAKCKEECEHLRLQLKNAVEDAACARLNGEEARREILRLSEEIKNQRLG
ncbi:MAG: cell division protein ZapA [Clostridia bacterium]|nr:cell division protein ZapA [Clostridia bacterium]